MRKGDLLPECESEFAACVLRMVPASVAYGHVEAHTGWHTLECTHWTAQTGRRTLDEHMVEHIVDGGRGRSKLPSPLTQQRAVAAVEDVIAASPKRTRDGSPEQLLVRQVQGLASTQERKEGEGAVGKVWVIQGTLGAVAVAIGGVAAAGTGGILLVLVYGGCRCELGERRRLQ